jgi:hypothetical protein
MSFSAIAADPAPTNTTPPAPSATAPDDDTTDAARGTFTDGAAATDHAGHPMDYSTKEPDLDRKPTRADQQVNITGVVEARAPDSQIICKFSPIIGSRLSTRLCLPFSRWKQMHEDAVQAIRDGQAASNYGGVHP